MRPEVPVRIMGGGEAYLAEWVLTKVVKVVEAGKTLKWYVTRYLHAAYAGLPMSLQAEWK